MIGDLLCLLLQIYVYVLIARIVLSWIPSLPEPLLPIARALYAVTDPVLTPLRGRIPPLQLGGVALDLSPIIVFVVIAWVLRPIVCIYLPI
jgi:YggT family protein